MTNAAALGAISGDDCSAIIRDYDLQGWHRTATSVDSASAEWLVNKLNERGVESELLPFPFRRVDPEPCSVSAGDWSVAGYPMPDTDLPAMEAPISGTISDEPSADAIALIRVSQRGQSALLEDTRTQAWRAIIAVTGDLGTGLALRNSWQFDAPSGPPIAQVPAAAWESLTAAKQTGEIVTIRCGAVHTETTAFNVAGFVPGTSPDLAPLVMLTPRSGWWHCAGERGGGVAIWLEVARRIASLNLRRSVRFLATTGHELGFLGLRRYFEADPALAPNAAAWLHLGANIGGSDTNLGVRASDERLIELAREAAAQSHSSSDMPNFGVAKVPPGGEALEVANRGGRYIAMTGGGFSLFHTPEDRWPVAIDQEAIARHGMMALNVLRALDKET